MVYYCPFCGEPFTNIGGFIYHVKEKHGDLLVYGNTCLICRRGFSSYKGLVKHVVSMARKGECLHLLTYYLVTNRYKKIRNKWAGEMMQKCFQS